MKTGKLKIINHAMAREVTTNAEGLATGVFCVNTEDGREYQARAKYCCAGCQRL